MKLNIEPYLNKKKNITEFEKQLIDNDDNHMLNKIRPLSSKSVAKIPSKNLLNFVDDLNKKVNKILYSSVSNKFIERIFGKKIRVKKNLNTIKNNMNKSSSDPLTNLLYFKREKALMLEKIKRNINEYKNEKNKKWNFLKEKNRMFRKKMKSTIDEQVEKYYKSMNQQRIIDFSRTLNKCMSDIIIRKENFQLPKIKLNIENVYSRLYHNAVFLKEIEQKNSINNINNSNLSNNNSFNNKSETQTIYKKVKDFKIKNIIKNSNGKEFTIKITPEIKRKCFLNYSGGPIRKLNNYEEISFKDEEEKPYLITLGKINDENGNNNLQIAVKRHLIDFVQYFLDKKCDINYQNNNGDTALHIAMVENNIEIIELLLDNNADLLIKNKEGRTPFDLASDRVRKKFNLETLLLERNSK